MIGALTGWRISGFRNQSPAPRIISHHDAEQIVNTQLKEIRGQLPPISLETGASAHHAVALDGHLRRSRALRLRATGRSQPHYQLRCNIMNDDTDNKTKRAAVRHHMDADRQSPRS